MHILIVEDDDDIADLVAYNLERQGWTTSHAADGSEGWEQIRTKLPDMVILDIMLPGMDGLSIFRAMKDNAATKDIPALFLTARAQLEDKLEGLQLGADDYMTKPFSTKELVLRVRNLQARLRSRASRLIVRSAPLVLDKNTLRATAAGESLELTPTEFKLLACLIEREGRVQNRYDLQQELFGYADTTQSRALDTHIKRLRQKLGSLADRISTERGVGYVYRSGTST
ncbi:MAG: response regulator transcription factor [Akkermansia sp.]